MDRNCTPPAINEFPKDLFSKTTREHGAVLIHIFVTIYLFTALAMICDEYFVPAVERICHVLKIPHDIGGATFMATATSSPELFVNIVGTFITEGDIGLGTIVGSAVFNILAVTACCGFTTAAGGNKLKLDWWPLTRDSLIYGISVCLLIIFLNNEKVEWYEALILVLVYIVYLVFLIFDKFIQQFFKENFCQNCLSQSNTTCDNTIPKISSNLETSKKDETKDESEEKNDITLWKYPSEISKIRQVIWIITWPINFAFFLTVPHCEKVKSNKWIPVAFVMCILWIGMLSYILSWMITVIGDTLRIPDSVMGISFLAIGAGVPEAVSSIVVVKKGKGAMGISNSLGSNTFDILLCLGVPWLLKATVVSSNKWVNINSSGLQYSTVTLLVTLIAFYFALTCNKFKLDKWIGLYCLIIYILFVILATLIELNVFFPVNSPTCGR
ncbi:sodium/potassium/calcium exchanger 3-like isoform X2 [Diabrotica virgifera virgifera]|uniref:Sodium/calcium exchanger membrane region domain-containing protein n=1 Tax=Diabrotica virgifera virgifera TaxID=50390 RepID=A0ABM5KBT0_DIAVI|nr:sodium/potassium/calcium exchanger 3-like isoform X2 [Diabrotica virgifera virgifera]